MSDWKHITMFDREYPMEKQAEGMAVHQAVATGACERCGFLERCSTDDSFKPPVFAWCFRKKLRFWADGGRRSKSLMRKYIVQILLVFNWLYCRRWEWIFGKEE